MEWNTAHEEDTAGGMIETQYAITFGGILYRTLIWRKVHDKETSEVIEIEVESVTAATFVAAPEPNDV
jgi:hypothetical protein